MSGLSIDALIENIQSSDDDVRAAARDGAGPAGAPAIAPLAEIAAGGDLESARAAQQAMQNIVYHAGRPDQADQADAVGAALLQLLSDSQPLELRRDALWMTWQLAGSEAVEPVAALLDEPDLREDARMALERLPGKGATDALQNALEAADDPMQKAALAHSLQVRGVDADQTADFRLKPIKSTSVQPVGRS